MKKKELKIIKLSCCDELPKKFTGIVESGPVFEWTMGEDKGEHIDKVLTYYIDGKISRFDGPAIERSNGNHEWWANGFFVFEGTEKDLKSDMKATVPGIIKLAKFYGIK